MNNVELASMNNVELASVNKVELASMNNVELTSMNNVELASMNRVELARMSWLGSTNNVSTMLLQHCSVIMLVVTMLKQACQLQQGTWLFYQYNVSLFPTAMNNLVASSLLTNIVGV